MRCRGRSAARRCRSRPARGRSTRDRGTRWPRLRRRHGRPRRVRAGREDPSVAGPTHLIPGPVGATRRSGFAGVTPPASGTRASASERRRDDRGQDPGPEHRAEQARTAVRGRTRGPCRSCPPLAGTTGSGPRRAPVRRSTPDVPGAAAGRSAPRTAMARPSRRPGPWRKPPRPPRHHPGARHRPPYRQGRRPRARVPCPRGRGRHRRGRGRLTSLRSPPVRPASLHGGVRTPTTGSRKGHTDDGERREGPGHGPGRRGGP